MSFFKKVALKFYNSLTRKTEFFFPISSHQVTIYSCGPTVYQNPHIGNWRYFLFTDILSRYLRFKGYKTLHVMNLTDIDDKIIRNCFQHQISLKSYTQKYIDIFFRDLARLKCQPCSHYPKATDHITEMMQLIRKLISLGFAYQDLKGSIYFRIKKFKNYASLIDLDFDQSIQTSSIPIDHDEYEKEVYGDFALWKAYRKEDGEIYFGDETIPKGRPGWHIECSAMALKYLGDQIDIHTGGIDNKFPHHVNEIAQIEAITNKPFVRYFLHSEHLVFNHLKMSKSLHNYILIDEVIDKFSPLVVRFSLLRFHYHHRIFLSENLSLFYESQQIINRFSNFYFLLKKKSESPELILKKESQKILDFFFEIKKSYHQALDDDLNIPKALGLLFKFIRFTFINSDSLDQIASTRILDELNQFFLKEIFGQNSLSMICDYPFEKDKITKELNQLLEKREHYRAEKDYVNSDKIRDQIKSLGYQITDTELGPLLQKI